MLPQQSSLSPIPLELTPAPQLLSIFLCTSLHLFLTATPLSASLQQPYPPKHLLGTSWRMLYGFRHIQPPSEAMRFSCNRLDEYVRWTLEGGMIIYVQLWRTALQFWAELRKDEQYYAGVSRACEIQYSLEKYNIAQSMGTLGCHSCWMWWGTGHGETEELGAVLIWVNTRHAQKARVCKTWPRSTSSVTGQFF